MQSNPLVTVVVPTRNSGQTLEACLDSVRQQSYRPIQLVVVDRFSNDLTLEIAERLADKVIPDIGPERSEQRNAGAEAADGQYLAMIDSDMVLSPEVISQAVAKLESGEETAGIIIPEESFGQGFWAQCKRLERSYYSGVDWMEGCRLFRKSDFEKVGGYDIELVSGEDWELSQRIAGQGRLERIEAKIRHDEGRLSLWRTVRKKIYYAGRFARYMERSGNLEQVSSQTSVVARYRMFLSDPKRLWAKPTVGLGMLFMKTCEFGAGGLGLLLHRLRRLSRSPDGAGGDSRPESPDGGPDILVLNCRTRNLGDRAIARCLAEQLRAEMPDCRLTFDTDEPDADHAVWTADRVVPAMINVRQIKIGRNGYGIGYLLQNALPIVRVLGNYLYATACALLGLSGRAVPAVAALRQADLVVWAGGDYVADVYGKRIMFRFWDLWLAKRMNKPTAIYAQTFGPFTGRASRRRAAVSLGRAALLLPRDEISQDLLKLMGLTAKSKRVADTALLLEPEEGPAVEQAVADLGLDQGPAIGFALIEPRYSVMKPNNYDRYLETMASLVRQAEAAGYRPVFVSATTEDKEAIGLAKERHGLEYPVFDAIEMTPGQAKAVLSRLKALVSSRMHPIILATGAGVPAMGINLLPKMRDYLELVGLEGFHLWMDRLEAGQAEQLLGRLLDELPEMTERLSRKIAALQPESRKNAIYVREMWEAHQGQRPRRRLAHFSLTTRFWPSSGGKEMSIDRIARALAADGDYSEVVCFRFRNQGNTDEFDLKYPLPISRTGNWLTSWSGRAFHEAHRWAARPASLPLKLTRRLLAAGLSLFQTLVSRRYLLRLTRRQIRLLEPGPVVLHCHTFNSVMAALRLRRTEAARYDIRVVYVNGYIHRRSGFWPSDRYISQVVRRVDVNLCVSRASAQALIDDFGADPQNTLAYGIWIEQDELDALVPPDSYRNRPYGDKARVLYVGRVEVDKGIREMIAAIRLINERGLSDSFEFTVIGSGNRDLMAELSGLEKESGNVRCLGIVRKPELWSHYAQADLMLMPSRWEEAGGNVALEAYAFGLPVVGSDWGGIPEILERFRFRRKLADLKPETIAEALEGLWQEMRQAGHQTVSQDARANITHFSLERRFAVYDQAVRRTFRL